MLATYAPDICILHECVCFIKICQIVRRHDKNLERLIIYLCKCKAQIVTW